VPFWPGGFDDIDDVSSDPKTLGKEAKGLRSIPPGFSRGLRLPGDPVEDEELVAIDPEETGVLDETVGVVYHILYFEGYVLLTIVGLCCRWASGRRFRNYTGSKLWSG
jgi:hypothetical protein